MTQAGSLADALARASAEGLDRLDAHLLLGHLLGLDFSAHDEVRPLLTLMLRREADIRARMAPGLIRV